MFEIQLPSLNATRELASTLAALTTVPQLIALNGTLGAGKTQFVRYFAETLGVASENVTSPTYVLLQRYTGAYRIYHFDFYRLNSCEEVWDLGFDELVEEPAVVIVEWADKFPECLPPDYLEIQLGIDVTGDQELRTARLVADGPRSLELLRKAELQMA